MFLRLEPAEYKSNILTNTNLSLLACILRLRIPTAYKKVVSESVFNITNIDDRYQLRDLSGETTKFINILFLLLSLMSQIIYRLIGKQK